MWEEFKQEMSHDFLSAQNTTEEQAYNNSLKSINIFLQNYNRSMNDYKLVPYDISGTREERVLRNYRSEVEITVSKSDLNAARLLNGCQKKAFDEITNAVNSQRGGAFFLDGPG